VSWAYGPDPVESDFQYLGYAIPDFNNMNMISQENFSIPIVVPNIACQECVIRARYVSNNPDENDRGEIFYQCADVIITNEVTQVEKAPAPAPAKAPNFLQSLIKSIPRSPTPTTDLSCCTKPQWELNFYETGSWRQPTEGFMAYDAINQYIRVDTYSGDGITIYDGHFQMYNNFSNGIEYYYNVENNTCLLYGLDIWQDWCYGDGQTEEYLETIDIGGAVSNLWTDGDFTFGGAQSDCRPVLRARDGALTIYYNVTYGIEFPDVFTPPEICLSTPPSGLPAPAEHVAMLAQAFKRR